MNLGYISPSLYGIVGTGCWLRSLSLDCNEACDLNIDHRNGGEKRWTQTELIAAFAYGEVGRSCFAETSMEQARVYAVPVLLRALVTQRCGTITNYR
jgi:hypothetical protein